MFNAIRGEGSGIEFAYLAGLLGQAGGLSDMITQPLMLYPQRAFALGAGANQLNVPAYGDYTEERQVEGAPPGTTERVFNYDKVIQDKGMSLMDGTPDFFNKMTQAFANAFKIKID